MPVRGARRPASATAPSDDRALTHAEAAHILRRLTFGPFPGGVEAAVRRFDTPAALVASLVDAEPVPFEPPASIDVAYDPGSHPVLGDGAIVTHWVSRMTRDEAAVHERMMWFWHNIFTTGADNITFLLLWKQLRTLHRHATGNLRDLAKAMVIDPAMLMWLDGNASSASAPNENLGRELMELFLLGRGNYTEADVRAAARSLSGWRVDDREGRAFFLPQAGPTAPDTYLGRTARFDPDLVIDTILEQPACAPYIVGRLWKHFIGGPRDEAQIARWADDFRASDYELRPLLASMLSSEAFAGSAGSRPRSTIEWFTAFSRATALEDYRFYELRDLGQSPYYPPNVAGWPADDNWVSAPIQMARALFAANHVPQPPDVELGDGAGRRMLRWCGIWVASEQTERTMERLVPQLTGSSAQQRTTLLRAALLSPEFATA